MSRVVSMPQLGGGIGLALLLASLSSVAGPPPLKPKLFLFAGQSNMVGVGNRTTLTSAERQALTDVLAFVADASHAPPQAFSFTQFWVPPQGLLSNYTAWGYTPGDTWNAINPGHYDQVINSYGPEFATGRDLATSLGETIYVAKYALGGSGLDASFSPTWHPDAADPGAPPEYTRSLYHSMLCWATNALEAARQREPETEIAGFFWMQGESDASSAGTANGYRTNFTQFLQRVRNDLGRTNLPVVFGRISNSTHPSMPYRSIVRAAQAIVDAADTNAAMVDTDDLPLNASDNIHYTDAGLKVLGQRFARAWLTLACPFAGESHLDNGVVKVGINLAKGGSITYLSKSGTNDNLINNHDLGRQIQQSYYSGPQPYNPISNASPTWANWPWNPIQTGDCFGNPSFVLAHTNTGQILYVKCRPMQWALKNVPGECTFESWITLSGNVVTVSNRLLNLRTDSAEQFTGRDQELPAVYTIGRLYRLFSYAGNAPFRGGALTNFPIVPPPWQYWLATENWAALVDVNGWGLGVYHPGAVRFVGGFAGTPGSGGPNDDPTGYVSPLHVEVLDSSIEYTYTYHLILGTLQGIRDWVYAQPYRPGAHFRFCTDRQHWSYLQAGDTGWPVSVRLRVNLASNDPTLVAPYCAYYATNVPKLYIHMACRVTTPSQRTGQVFWQTAVNSGFSEARSYRFPIVADQQFRTYELNLSLSNSYTGLITRLRFDPAISGQSGDYADVAWISSSPIGAGEPDGVSLSIVQTGGVVVVSFPTVSNACLSEEGHEYLYDLEWRTNLLLGAWQGLPGFTNIVGDNRVKSLTNAASATATFYRVKARVE